MSIRKIALSTMLTLISWMTIEKSVSNVISEGLVAVSEINVRALAEIYDEKSIYLSVYLPLSGRQNDHVNKIYVDSRVKAIKDFLSPELKTEFEKTFEMIKDYLEQGPVSGEKGRVIFANSSASFLHVYRLAVAPEQSFVLDRSPYLLPLARLISEYEDYGVLLLDSQEAKFACIRSDIIEEKDHLSIDLMNKHKKGGWSQARFNHLRKGAIKSFLTEVAENVENTCGELNTKGFVIAGPGNAKQQLAELLPKNIQDKVLGLVDIPIGVSDDELVEESDSVLQEEELAGTRRKAKQFKTEILKGGLAVEGAENVKAALEQGRVNTLLILKGSSVPGWICERCQNIQAHARPPEECNRCGGQTSAVNVVEKLYELAVRTGADVEFVEKEDFPESEYVVGALLRY